MKEFKEFMESGSQGLSQLEMQDSLQKLKSEIFPNPSSVALKLGIIHLLSSVVSLVLCPQFGIRLFLTADHSGLMHYFSRFGGVGCYALCGAFYLGASFWLAKLLLGEFEWALLRRHAGLSVGGLSLLSLGFFSMISHEFNLELGLVWILGAIVSATVPLLTPNRHRPLLKI